jgi:L-fuconolactonase
MEVIDGYCHCGLSKYEPIERVREVMDTAGVSRAVLVQHLGEFDNTYIGSVVQRDPGHFAGVLLVDHRSPDAVPELQRLCATRLFRGVRLTTDALSATPDLFAVAGNLGLVIVLYAPQGIRPHLSCLIDQLELAPFTQLVVTHLGNPSLDGQSLAESATDVFCLSQFANVYLQVSGMKMFCPFPHEPFYSLITQALEKFGTQRLIWGSNYPVVGTAADYQADLRLLLDGRLPIPAGAIPKIAGENARRLWFA